MSFLHQPQASLRYPYEWLDKIATSLLILATLVLPVVTLPLTRDAINVPKELFLGGVAAAVLLLWLLRGVLARELFVRRSTVDLPAAVFLCAVIVSAVFSVSPSVAWLGRMGHFVLHAAVILLFALSAWLLVQYIRSFALWQVFVQTFCGAGALVMALHLLLNFSFLSPLLSWFGFNAATEFSSTFGIAVAIIATVAFGLLLERGPFGLKHAIPGVTAVLSILTLLRLGFTVSWIMFAVGIALLIFVGAAFVREVRAPFLSVLFFLFLVSLLFGLTKTPEILTEDLPVEVALGARASWEITERALFADVRRFLIGSGPGTYVYAFSGFRPAAFNLAPSFGSRFYEPYNTLFAFLAEIGAIGTVSFLFLVFVYAGMLASRRRRAPLPVFVVGAAWIVATVGLGAAYYSVTLWWFWWALLAFGIVGLSFASDETIREQTILTEVAPQYSLALSFAMILVVSTLGLLGVFAGRLFAAEHAYTRALRLPNRADQRSGVAKAVSYAPRAVEYHLQLARLDFEEAKTEADKHDPASAEAVARWLSSAVAEARLAAEYDPSSVETWETLSLMYLNARALAPDANEWARDATNRALLLEPANAVFHWRLGNIHEFAGKDDEAIQMYKKAIELKADYLGAYVSLSALYERQNQLTDAIAVFQPVLPLMENDPEMLFNAARLFYNRNVNGDTDRAEELFLRAVELRPDYSNALYSLGLLAERRGDTVQARQYFERVRELNPENTDIVQKLRSL